MFRFNAILEITDIENLRITAEVYFCRRRGLHPTAVENFPPQCAALNMTNVLVHQLTVEAAESGDRNASFTPQYGSFDQRGSSPS